MVPTEGVESHTLPLPSFKGRLICPFSVANKASLYVLTSSLCVNFKMATQLVVTKVTQISNT